MATENFEFTGKTVDDAIAEGLRTLKLRADQVEIEVLSKGSRGIFGLGSEPAQVRIGVRTAQTAPQPPAPAAIETRVAEAPTLVAAPAPPTPVATPASEQVDLVATPIVTVDERSPDASQGDDPAADEEPAGESDAAVEAIAVELLGELVRLMGFAADVRAQWKDGADELNEHGDRYLLLDVEGAELGALIGRRGEALDNLQYLLRLMVNQRLRKWKNVVVDVEGYKERRVTQLKQLATRTATQVASTGRAVSLEPMPPNERRIIHIALRDHPDVYTESTGEGDRRKVHIVAKH